MNQQDKQGQSALDHALIQDQAAVIETLLEAGADGNGPLWLWQGLQLAREDQLDEALPLLEQAAVAAAGPKRAWQFAMNGWSYNILTPEVFTWIVVGEARKHSRAEDSTTGASEAFQNASDAIPPDMQFVPLLQRTMADETAELRHRYQVARFAIRHHIANPNEAWQGNIFQEVERRAAGRTQSSGSSHMATFDFLHLP